MINYSMCACPIYDVYVHLTCAKTFRTILRPVENGVNVLIKKSRISVL